MRPKQFLKFAEQLPLVLPVSPSVQRPMERQPKASRGLRNLRHFDAPPSVAVGAPAEDTRPLSSPNGHAPEHPCNMYSQYPVH
jgi:hypothetical protein